MEGVKVFSPFLDRWGFFSLFFVFSSRFFIELMDLVEEGVVGVIANEGD